MVGVYALFCLMERKYYIGQSKDVHKRWREHKKKLRTSTHENKFLQRAWNKYGEQMFSFFIIEKSTPSKVYKRELWWIKKLRSYEPTRGYNRSKYGKFKRQ